MSKFKVGDIITGTAESDKRYAVTTSGATMEVTDSAEDGTRLEVEILSHTDKKLQDEVGEFYYVNEEYFKNKEYTFAELVEKLPELAEGTKVTDQQTGVAYLVDEVGDLTDEDGWVEAFTSNQFRHTFSIIPPEKPKQLFKYEELTIAEALTSLENGETVYIDGAKIEVGDKYDELRAIGIDTWHDLQAATFYERVEV